MESLPTCSNGLQMTDKLTKEEQDTWDILKRPVESAYDRQLRICAEEIRKEIDKEILADIFRVRSND